MKNKKLVKLAQKKNPDAFVSLIEENKMTMYKVAKSYLAIEEDVADAIQETVLSAYEHIERLKNPEYFNTWLIRILINKCKDILRKRERYCFTQETKEQIYEDHAHSDIEFHEMLKTLQEDDRMIFVLHYGEQFTVSQIAMMLKVKENTVKSRLSRGRKKIYEMMKKEEAYETQKRFGKISEKRLGNVESS